jgi:prepilin-type N-terminal cleavage/methylation domain-containing protein
MANRQKGEMKRDERQIVNGKSSIVNRRGFTLVELLVVVGVLALLLGVLVPALSQARRAARFMLGGQRQRHVVLAANLYAADHQGRYPESVATAAMLGRTWRWQEPRMMKACQPRAAGYRSSMAGYLRAYLPQAVVLSCPSSPVPYPYLEDFWQAGEQWNHPSTTFTDDPVFGNFCFYWGYVGHLSESERPFRGPRLDTGRPGHSHLLISDYFGFNHWRSPKAFGSCERPARAEITDETHEAAAHWFLDPAGEPDRANVRLKLQAGFVDGHVETYRPEETVTLEVAEALDGTTPAFSGMGLGAGQFYIPHSATPSRP